MVRHLGINGRERKSSRTKMGFLIRRLGAGRIGKVDRDPRVAAGRISLQAYPKWQVGYALHSMVRSFSIASINSMLYGVQVCICIVNHAL